MFSVGRRLDGYRSIHVPQTTIYDYILRRAAEAPPQDTSTIDWIGHANPAHSSVLAARGYLLMLARERDPDRAQ